MINNNDTDEENYDDNNNGNNNNGRAIGCMGCLLSRLSRTRTVLKRHHTVHKITRKLSITTMYRQSRFVIFDIPLKVLMMTSSKSQYKNYIVFFSFPLF